MTDGSYFVTICTKNREHFFGAIKNQRMILSELGQYTRDCRYRIPKHFPYIKIGEFICMPDHIHGIITIQSGRDAITARPQINQTRPNINKTNIDHSMDHPNTQGYKNRTAHDAVLTGIHGPRYGSLGYIINQYKGSITKFAKQHNIPFARQSKFYDHIITNDIEYYLIEQYIKNNPENR